MTTRNPERYDLFFRQQRLATCATLDECLDYARGYLDVDLTIWCGVRVAAVRMADGAALRIDDGAAAPNPLPPAA